MKISIIGTGYVGLVTGTCLSETGNKVICVDKAQDKITDLEAGEIPIYEPGLEEMIKRNVKNRNLRFTVNIKEAIEETDICFICVGTPMSKDGSADLRYVLEAAESIGQYMTHPMYIVDKSTVPVGTAFQIKKVIVRQLEKRRENIRFDLISNPEFLKEGSAVQDAMRPDRIVIGGEDPKAIDVMKELYKAFVINTNNFITMDIKSAEMTKYAANCMLAMKISFMNEMANICERVGADINKVRLGIGSDKRIGYSFIYPGCGYGGSCFPKDVRALIKTANDIGYTPEILNAVEAVNEAQKRHFANKIIERYGGNLAGKKFAVWGLAFKPETDDMREAASILVLKELLKRGAEITAYDPKVTEKALESYLQEDARLKLAESKYFALKDADALVLITEWAEFRTPDFEEMKKLMKSFVIFDGRNQYSQELSQKYGFEYHEIGVGK